MVSTRQLEFRGVTIGKDTDFKVVRVDGFAAPRVRSADSSPALRHGQHPGLDRYEGRTLTLVSYIREIGDAAALSARRDEFVAAFHVATDEEQPLSFEIPGVAGGGQRRIYCRPRGGGLVVDRRLTKGTANDVCQLHATDPRIYDDIESSETVGLPTGGTGLTWPITWTLNWGAVAESGSILAENAGNFDAPAVIRIDGPVTNPRIENLTLGLTLAADIVVADGDFLEFDTDARTVMLNGTASRYSTLTSTSQWWDLQPGTNEVRFRASTDTAAELTLTWRSAWIA